MPSRMKLHYRILTGRLLFILTLFQISRIIFAIYNPTTVVGNWSDLAITGLRYDVTCIFILNLPVLIFSSYPIRFSNNRNFQLSVSAWVIIVNNIALLFNLIDAGWFPYVQKRTTFDFFLMISEGEDFKHSIFRYIIDYFELLLIWISFIVCSFYFEKAIRGKIIKSSTADHCFPALPLRLFSGFIVISISIIGFRGGLQLKPLSVQAAARFVPSQSIPLVLNTPYTIIKSMGDTYLEDPEYMSADAAKQIFPLRKSMNRNGELRKLNLVLIVLESFSYDYISYYHPAKTTTPFIDSLMRVADCWPNTFANAKRSIEGIPAVIASIPALSENPFITSAYNLTKINSPASLLEPLGFTCGFFHGGTNGTMGFDNFTKLAGYRNYYGKNEFPQVHEDNLGQWGIHDHAFYHCMIETLDKWKEPFHAAVFSLSSHHPYDVPDKFSIPGIEKLNKTEKAIAYSDQSLRNFFEEAKSTPWYDSTIFIITADHSGPSIGKYTSGPVGAYHIPLIIVGPSGKKGNLHREIAQQTDVLPTILHLLNYQGNYSAFGRDLFAENNGWSVQFNNNSWQMINDRCSFRFDGEQAFDFRSRSNPQYATENNQTTASDSELVFLKAILQQYYEGLTHNSVVVP